MLAQFFNYLWSSYLDYSASTAVDPHSATDYSAMARSKGLAPSAPEAQHLCTSCSNHNMGHHPPHPPPYNPHAPHPHQHPNLPHSISYLYDAVEPKSSHRWLFRCALYELLLGTCAVVTGTLCITKTQYCPLYTGLWVGALYIANGVLGIMAAKQGRINYMISHLVFGILSLIASIVLAVFSTKNWQEMGYSEASPKCVIAQYNPNHIGELYRNGREVNFGACTMEFKLGIAMNTMLAFLAIIEGLNFSAKFLFALQATLSLR